jgi:D-alanine-D-alanine ligase
MKVAVIHGEVAECAGRDEKDVLVEVDAVSNGLAALGHEPIIVPVSLNLEKTTRTLAALHPAIAFNLVESLSGKGSLIHIVPALLDSLKIPYTGSYTAAIILTSNKVLAKRWLGAAGLPTPPWFTATERQEGLHISGPWLVKSAWEHASIGLDEDSIIPNADRGRLLGEMEARRDKLGGACLAEAFIDGREFNLSLLAGGLDPNNGPNGQQFTRGKGPEVLPPAEIRFDAYPPEKFRVVGYRSKWEEGSFEFDHTLRSFEFPETDTRLLVKLKELALNCWNLFDLRGYARVDFRVDRHGNPWILEVNTNPCLSPDAGFRAATERAGLNFSEVLKRIIKNH